ISTGETYLHMAATFTQRIDRIGDRFLDTKRVDPNLCAALRYLMDCFSDILILRVYGRNRTGFTSLVELIVINIDGNHLRTDCSPCLNSRQPYSTSALHSNPLAWGNSSALNSVETGHKSATECRSRSCRDVFRKGDQVRVGLGN